jgi:hypothetical protein
MRKSPARAAKSPGGGGLDGSAAIVQIGSMNRVNIKSAKAHQNRVIGVFMVESWNFAFGTGLETEHTRRCSSNPVLVSFLAPNGAEGR